MEYRRLTRWSQAAGPQNTWKLQSEGLWQIQTLTLTGCNIEPNGDFNAQRLLNANRMHCLQDSYLHAVNSAQKCHAQLRRGYEFKRFQKWEDRENRPSSHP